MRRFLPLFIVLLACASFVPTDSFAGKPSGGGGGGGGRGALQLVPEQVFPGPGELGDNASTSLSVGRSAVSFNMTVGTMSGFIRTIGIYRGRAGEIGPMVVRLSPSPIGINQLNGSIPIDRALATEISRNPSDFFIQINTTTYPGGSVRAQLR
jgi:hypothetical protein